MDDFRRFFLRGLGALIPTLATLGILVWVYAFINNNVGTHITDGLMRICAWVNPEPAPNLTDPDIDPLKYGTKINVWNDRGERLTIEHKVIHHPALASLDPIVRENAEKARSEALWRIVFAKYRLQILGFLIAIILVYFVGFFLASFIGRASWRTLERLLHRIPLVRAVYPHVKQVTDFLLSERSVDFSGVVAVQYPRKGVWSVGLSTGGPMRQVQDEVEQSLVSVFIPSSPTPVTGYVVQVPREDVIELNISIDEAFRYTISGGVIKPGAVLERPEPDPQGDDG